MDDTTLWFFFAYIVGTLFGMAVGYSSGARKGCEITIDQLCKNGFLRHRRKSDGDIELLKLNQED